MKGKVKKMATMSILGLYQWDNTIFDAMVLPDQIDKTTLINNILDECAELEVLYTNPDFIKNAIGYWSMKRYHAWDKLQTVLYENYDPFINIKRDEVRTIEYDPNLTQTASTNAFDAGAGTERESIHQGGRSVTTEHFHVEGDSAITDAQDVAMKEGKLRLEYDLYNIIIEEFKRRFCLMIY